MHHYTSEERGRVDCLPPALSAIAPQRGGGKIPTCGGGEGGNPFGDKNPVFPIVCEYLSPANDF
eukprot:12795585-Prorocentrum_lima.AAC.1